MPRKPAVCKRISRPILYDSLRFYLETGDLKKALHCYPNCPGKAYTFMLGHPSEAAKARLKAAWLQHREDILSEWKKSKKPGLPWAEKEF